MKKNSLIVFLFILFLIVFSFNNIYANTSSKEFVDIKVPAAVVIDYDTGRVLFDKNASDKRPMASLTKIMTSILLVENCEMDEMIEVPSQATWIGGSTVGLKKGDKLSAKSLLYGMLLPSGNDCAYTVGIHIGGTIENFAKWDIAECLDVKLFFVATIVLFLTFLFISKRIKHPLKKGVGEVKSLFPFSNKVNFVSEIMKFTPLYTPTKLSS